MNKLSAILVDDEAGSLDNLGEILGRHCPEILVTGRCQTVAEAFELINSLKPSVVFLDIQMKNETGFDLLRKFEPVPFEVVFVTAFDLYGIQAVKFSALDYLLKPIDIAELKVAVDKLINKQGSLFQQAQLNNLKMQLQHPAEPVRHKIALPGQSETLLVKPEQILYCQSENSYTTFYLTDGRQKLICKSIKDFEILLVPYGFLRVHQRFLVNLHHIHAYSKKDGLQLTLQNGIAIPVSKNKKEAVLNEMLK